MEATYNDCYVLNTTKIRSLRSQNNRTITTGSRIDNFQT